jgi:hypothetical protein
VTQPFRYLKCLTALAIPTAIAAIGGREAVAAGFLVAVVVVALCWVIADSARSRRLAMLIAAARSNGNTGVESRLDEIAGSRHSRSAGQDSSAI